jgi:type IV secretory pathway VirB4 component
MRNEDEDGGDPVKVKTDFIETICEIMIGGKYGLSPIEKSIIDRSATNIYDDYIRYLQKTNKDQDYEHAPTLVNFYEDLLEQALPEAQNIALSLERYVKGAYDIFSHHTNVEIKNRFTIYDIKEIGPGLKELGLQICLDNIWNKMIRNAAEGKRTWFYIDEFYLMMQKPTSASYIAEIWKRARKWKGNPCAITQNVEDMLKSEDARTVINNCSFVTMLGQSPINKTQLSAMYNLSLAEQKYIASAKPGMGIIICNNDVIPMNDDFPKNTKLYKMMTTKPDERIY